MDHVIIVKADGGVLLADCSCGYGLTPSRLHTATLDQLAQLADEHMQDAESSRTVDPVVNPRSVLPPEFYGDAPNQVEFYGAAEHRMSFTEDAPDSADTY